MKPSGYFVEQDASNRDGKESVTYIFIHMEKKTGSKWKRTFEKGCRP